MKIVCDSCSTKYSISDDKVRGKVFKIRCKKCSHIIVVKGNAEAAPAVAEGPVDAVWHLVVDGDQVGPLTDADVRARVARNEITPENYVWKEGFSDWLRLADVPEFSDLAGAVAPSTSIGGELFSDSGSASVADPSGAGGFFGALGGGQDLGHASGQSARNRLSGGGDEDAFAAAAASPASDGADLFGVAPVVARADSGRVRGRGANGTGPVAGRHDGGRVENLTAQRSENSVLFSLSNLQSLAAPAAAVPRPATAPATTEGSGLIDIRAMAASTLKSPAGGGSPLFGGGGRSAEDDLPAFGAFSSAAPVLLSMPSQSGPPKWIYALIVLAGVLLIAVGVAFFTILGKPVIVEAPPPPPAPVAAPAPTPAGKPAEDKAAAKPLAEGELPPREGEAAAAGDKGGEKAGDKKVGGGAVARRVGKGGKRAGAAAAVAAGGAETKGAAATPAEPDKVKPAKGSLDDLIEGALKRPGATSSGAKPKVEDDSAKKPEGGGPLQKAAVVAGMNGIKGKISACYQQYKQSGMAMVNVVIGKSGKVSSATVTGKFAGTPTGTCVESAVKTASFPPSDGLSTPYPFTLR